MYTIGKVQSLDSTFLKQLKLKLIHNTEKTNKEIKRTLCISI